MSKRRKAQVERYYDGMAAKYDHRYVDVFQKWNGAVTCEHIKPHLRGLLKTSLGRLR